MKVVISFVAMVLGLGISSGLAHAEILSTHDNWLALKNPSGGDVVCYAGSEPLKDEGDYVKRGDIYVLVTHAPQSKSKVEVSVEAGYDYLKGSDVTIKIGDQSFTMFTNGGNAWVKGDDTDQKLVAAMKRGSTMVVTGKSWRGTATKDTYSLVGFTAAFNASKAACGL